MEIILKQTIDMLGQEGDIVKVKPGYARNFLIPKKMAMIVNKSNLAILKQEQETIKSRLEKQKQEALGLAGKLSGITIEIARKVGEEDRLFGSVTAADIALKLEETGISIDRRAILMREPIKTIGQRKIQVKVGYQMTADISLQVVPEVIGDTQ